VQKTDRAWETGCHLSPLVLLVGIPVANIIAPLIIWFIRKDNSPSTDRHGRAVLNFQIAMTLYFAGMLLINIILAKIATKVPFFELLVLPLSICIRAWAYLNILFILRAAYDSAQGKLYQYPLSIRFFPQ
jgi:hypothetical protein